MTYPSVMDALSEQVNALKIDRVATSFKRSCADAGGEVLAVTAWPKVMLEPGEATELYVTLRQTRDNDTTARPSLLDGGR